ncbi:hypothetical protein HPB50_002878 [Hyalomma asiaticum]|uniref:Uncharacterized protein n=1 Tax=Hyalomma asiaticum TaxID=266040 RepID=A0ACB7SAY5_HYAAI|nr:hypothetical protein HPB50_002878 [Hyalomma asiaticum]
MCTKVSAVLEGSTTKPRAPGNFQEDGGHPLDGATTFGEKRIAPAGSRGTGKGRKDKAEQERATSHDERRPRNGDRPPPEEKFRIFFSA